MKIIIAFFIGLVTAISGGTYYHYQSYYGYGDEPYSQEWQYPSSYAEGCPAVGQTFSQSPWTGSFPQTTQSQFGGQQFSQPPQTTQQQFGGQQFSQPPQTTQQQFGGQQFSQPQQTTQPQFEQQQFQQTTQQSSTAIEQQHPNLIVMFTKDACPYCQYMKPILQQVEMKFGNNIKFLYVDIEQNPQYPSQYNFQTVPHIVYFKDGKQLEAHGSGDKTMTVEQVEAKIQTHFGSNLTQN